MYTSTTKTTSQALKFFFFN